MRQKAKSWLVDVGLSRNSKFKINKAMFSFLSNAVNCEIHLCKEFDNKTEQWLRKEKKIIARKKLSFDGR